MSPTAHSTASADEILSRLLEHGKKHKENKLLEEFLEELQWDSLNDAISWLFDKRNKRGATLAPDAVHYLYRGLASETQRDKRTQSTLAILHYLRECDHLSRATRNDTLDRLALALDSAEGAELAAAAQDLVNSLRRSDDPHASWRSVLPKILALIAECQQVPYDGDFIPGTDFRDETITTLLELDWSPDSLVSLAIMFSDMNPNPETTLALAEKFCGALPALAPHALVALAQALLLLLREHGSAALFLALARYFDMWVYGEPQPQPGLSPEEAKRWRQDAPAAEATLRLCALESAGAGSLRVFLRTVSKMAACPELVLSPFLLATLLALSEQRTYQDSCLKVVAAAVVRATEEQRFRSASAWVRSVTVAPVKPERAFMLVIQHNHQSERVLRGVVSLAMRLLDSQRSPVAAQGSAICAVAGSVLCAAVSQRPREMAPLVLEQLYERSRDSVDGGSQFIECVRAVVHACPESVSCSGNATRAALASIGRHVLGPRLVRALAPALAPSAGAGDAGALRDTLIIGLRKDLASNKLETRLNAVSSLLHLLRRLAVKHLAAISASQCSQLMPSTSRSQAGTSTSQRGFSPSEATCMDLLRALARCFGQQASVRQALYHGLGRSASRNPELLGYVHNMLLGQLTSYLSPEGEDLPLAFGACLDQAGALREPLGHLLLACAQALAQGCDLDGSGKRLRAALDGLVDSLPGCQPDDIVQGLVWDREVLAQAQDCLDALLMHVLLSDPGPAPGVAAETEAKMAAIVAARERCAEFAKPVAGGKGAKGAKGRKAKAANTQPDEDAKKAKPRGPVPKPREAVFDPEALLRLLDFAFRAEGDSEPLRRAALRLAQGSASVGPDEDGPAFPAPAAAALWAFARTEQAGQSDSFGPALRLVTDLAGLVGDRWPDSLPAFFQQVGGGLEAMLDTLRLRLDADADEDEELALVQALAALAAHSDPAQAHLAQLLTWLEKRLSSHEPSSTVLPVLALVLSLRRRTRPTPALDIGLARQLLHLLGPADYHHGGDEVFSRLRLLSAESAPAALVESCASAKEALAEAVWLAERLDSELVALGTLSMPAESETFQRERSLCLHVGQLLKPAHALASSQLCAKSQRALTTLLTALYACATRLAKHFLARAGVDNRALAHAKFDVLVKLMGGPFSATVAGFILNVQNAGPRDDGKAAKNQVDYLLPGITFQKETLERFLIRLSKAVKTDLMQFVKVTEARDFRLKKTLLVGEDQADHEQPRADTSRSDTSRANTSKANTSRGEASKGDTSKGDTTIGDTTRADTTRADTSIANTSKHNASKHNVSKRDTSKRDASKRDTSKRDASKRDSSKRDANDEDASPAPAPKRSKKARR